MTLTATQDDLAYALAERRVDAELTAQTLRDCLQIGMGIGRALEVQAVTLTTERTLTGQLPRGGDLSASFDRFARAMRRTVILLHKTGDDIVALYRAALADVPEQPEPEPSKPGSSCASAPPTHAIPPATECRHESPEPTASETDRADAADAADDDDPADRPDEQDPAETLPDRPLADLIADIKRDLALADPRHKPDPTLTAEPAVQTGPWAYERPPLEPATPNGLSPGFITLDDLRRLPSGPSG
jgi:hypothetical protein